MIRKLLGVAGHPAILAALGTLALTQAIAAISAQAEALREQLTEVEDQAADVTAGTRPGGRVIPPGDVSWHLDGDQLGASDQKRARDAGDLHP